MQSLMERYLLRWRLEWPGRHTYGMWSNAASPQDKSNSASSHSTEGLLYACVEAKNIRTRAISHLYRVPGHKFCAFQWKGGIRIGEGQMTASGMIHAPTILGMTVIESDQLMNVFIDGRVEPEAKTTDDKHFHYGRLQI